MRDTGTWRAMEELYEQGLVKAWQTRIHRIQCSFLLQKGDSFIDSSSCISWYELFLDFNLSGVFLVF